MLHRSEPDPLNSCPLIEALRDKFLFSPIEDSVTLDSKCL